MTFEQRISILAFGLILGGVAPAVAEDPDVTEILTKADEATKALDEVTYDGKYFGEGPPEVVAQMGRVEAHVKAKEPKRGILSGLFGGSQDPIHVEGVVHLPGSDEGLPFTIACDGKHVYRIEPSAKVFFEGELPKAEQMLRRAMPVYMREFLHPTPFSDELKGTAKYEGTKEIGGVPCDVVYVVYENKSESRWCFGQKDSLPRRVERIFEEGGVKGATVQEVHNLNPKPRLTPADFRLSAPKGFETREFEEQQDNLLPIGSSAPAFELKTPEGKTVTLADLKGHVVLLNFWANYSGPAKLAMGPMQKLSKEFSGKPVAIFGVHCWESSDDPLALMRERGYDYPVLLKGDKAAEDFKLKNIPAFFVISAEGKILHATVGYRPGKEQEISKVIQAALETVEK